MPCSRHPVPWQGTNHVALVTADMDATVRFPHGVLGAECVGALAAPHLHHHFFRVGERSIIDHALAHSVDFTGPNGITLEASCWLVDPTATPVDYDGPLFAGSGSAPAVRPGRGDSSLTSTPTTVLAASHRTV